MCVRERERLRYKNTEGHTLAVIGTHLGCSLCTLEKCGLDVLSSGCFQCFQLITTSNWEEHQLWISFMKWHHCSLWTKQVGFPTILEIVKGFANWIWAQLCGWEVEVCLGTLLFWICMACSILLASLLNLLLIDLCWGWNSSCWSESSNLARFLACFPF